MYGYVLLQLSDLQPVLSLINSTVGEILSQTNNGNQQNRTVDSAAMLHAASLLFCQREPILNETNEKKPYFDKFRPGQQTSRDSFDNSSTYIYDNTTSM